MTVNPSEVWLIAAFLLWASIVGSGITYMATAWRKDAREKR